MKKKKLIAVSIVILGLLIAYFLYSSRFQLRQVPAADLKKVTGTATLGSSYDIFYGSLYNGSDWIIKEIIFKVTTKNSDGTVMWSRNYKNTITLEPLTSTEFTVTVTSGRGHSSFSWSIVSARGYREK